MAEKKIEKKTGNTALDAVMSQIRKEFGEMAIMRLGDWRCPANPFTSACRGGRDGTETDPTSTIHSVSRQVRRG